MMSPTFPETSRQWRKLVDNFRWLVKHYLARKGRGQ